MNKNNSLAFFLVIIISGAVIALGIFLARTNILERTFDTKKIEFVKQEPPIQPINTNDHILGDPDADILIIEYSDFECPYCKDFHITMNRIINDYATQGRIAWVFRHSPLEEIHVNAKRVALVSECVAKIGGESKFWSFTDEVFNGSPQSLIKNNTDLILSYMELDQQEINDCVENDIDVTNKIEKDLQDVKYLQTKDKEFGTPYNIIKTKTGLTTTVSGIIPHQLLIQIIDDHSIDFN